MSHASPEVTSFAELSLSPASLKALSGAHFERPTPIQARAIPPALQGKDVIGVAATGTGKTAAFLLPILDRLAGKPGARALILAPTRELAVQIGEELERFGYGRGVRGAVVIGGVGMGRQASELSSHQVVIATPGRLVDHLQQGSARLDRVEVLVLDEADRMLDMGFKPQLTKILARVPRARQTMLFSATMGDEVAEFARAHLKDPVRVEVIRSGTTAARAEQRIFQARQEEKLPLLLSLLADDQHSTLVFTRTKRRADRVAKGLDRAGHKVTRIHADRSQGQRRAALEGFKDGSYRVLVATDIAARGIDVADIGHVVNFDLPHVPEDYVHRVGRTARNEASGRASSFVSPEEQELLRGIERLVRTPIPRAEVPRGSELFEAELKRATEARASQPAQAHAPGRAHGQPRSHGEARAHGDARPNGDARRQGEGRRHGEARPHGQARPTSRARPQRGGGSGAGPRSHAVPASGAVRTVEAGGAGAARRVGSWGPKRRGR